MYGSYGSYSSMSAVAAPMDMAAANNIRPRDTPCAYPSWPRRSSLSDSEHGESRATSFLSDDDLFLSDPYDDDARSVSSASSTSSPMTTAIHSPAGRIASQDLLQMERARAAVQRELLRQVKQEKESRRQAAQRSRRSASSKKTPPKTKAACLSTITEAGE